MLGLLKRHEVQSDYYSCFGTFPQPGCGFVRTTGHHLITIAAGRKRPAWTAWQPPKRSCLRRIIASTGAMLAVGEKRSRFGGSNPPPATMNATAEMQWRSTVKRSVGSPKLFSTLPKTCLVRLLICVVGRLHRRSTHTGGRGARVGVMIQLRCKVPNEAHSLDCSLSFTSGAESCP
jgi:hypothetical protein